MGQLQSRYLCSTWCLVGHLREREPRQAAASLAGRRMVAHLQSFVALRAAIVAATLR